MAQEKFDELLPGLEGSGRLDPVERDALALYCAAWADWVEAGEQVAKLGRIVKAGGRTRYDRDGKLVEKAADRLVPNPYLAIQQEAARNMERLAMRLRLTPDTRTAVAAVPLQASLDALGDGKTADEET